MRAVSNNEAELVVIDLEAPKMHVLQHRCLKRGAAHCFVRWLPGRTASNCSDLQSIPAVDLLIAHKLAVKHSSSTVFFIHLRIRSSHSC